MSEQNKELVDIKQMKEEINKQISDKETFNLLLETTFKKLSPQKAKAAMLEGAMRGFSFRDFLEKNVYAVPFSGDYSLVTSIDHARKIGMRSGVVGSDKPEFELDENGDIISCTVTVHRKIEDYIGNYSATVYFSEYTTGRNLWASKPKTMIAKVAEMHALRKACPEEMSQMYIEEDYAQGSNFDVVDEKIKAEVDNINDLETLKHYYNENKGSGKGFDKYVTRRKKELQGT